MKLSDLKNADHWPTLLAACLYSDFSFMVWTVLGPLGARIGETLGLSAGQKGLMVALPIQAPGSDLPPVGESIARFKANKYEHRNYCS
jgi:nitrate/nitrite transporter NarK